MIRGALGFFTGTVLSTFAVTVAVPLTWPSDAPRPQRMLVHALLES
jgi:hypothetical protein